MSVQTLSCDEERLGTSKDLALIASAAFVWQARPRTPRHFSSGYHLGLECVSSAGQVFVPEASFAPWARRSPGEQAGAGMPVSDPQPKRILAELESEDDLR